MKSEKKRLRVTIETGHAYHEVPMKTVILPFLDMIWLKRLTNY